MTTSPAPRRQRKSATERRSEIATAARWLALADGLAAVTLRGIATRIGVASGLIAHYEPSMEALVARTFEAITRDEFDEVRAALEVNAAGETSAAAQVSAALDVSAAPETSATARRHPLPPTVRLATLIDTLLDDSRDDVSSVWADAWSLGRRMPLVAEATRRRMDAWHAFATDLIRDGCASGDFHSVEPEIVALQLFALIDSTTAYSLVDYRSAEERGQVVRRSLEAALSLHKGSLDALKEA